MLRRRIAVNCTKGSGRIATWCLQPAAARRQKFLGPKMPQIGPPFSSFDHSCIRRGAADVPSAEPEFANLEATIGAVQAGLLR